MHPFFRWLFFLLIPSLSFAQERIPDGSHTGSWGDQGNGTYINPVLYADYSDPDVIRVDSTYYMVCSEFANMGMPVLRSDDMVNWTIIGQVFSRLDFPQYDHFQRYGRGSWAPAIRFHDHRFYLYFCTPDEGLFMSSAVDPSGPWSPLVRVHAGPGWEDPCPFWDEDGGGQAYLGHSRTGAGPIIIHKLSPDGTTLLDAGVTVYTGPTAEGTKIFKLDGYYYISIPEGGVSKGWQTVLRSTTIYGPYEKRVVLEKGTTAVNGPHQGADIPGDHPIRAPQTDDEFSSPALGLQWESNHNPVPSAWSLTQRPGWLMLHALRADSFWHARNTFTQKIMGATGEITTRLDATGLAEGQKSGLCSMSNIYTLIGVRKKEGRLLVFFDNARDSAYQEKPVRNGIVYLKMRLRIKTRENQCLYSLDNKTWEPLGPFFETRFGYWKGTRVGLFSYDTLGDAGTAAFDWFHYDYDGPK